MNSRTIKGGGWALLRPCISGFLSLETPPSPTSPAEKGSLEVKEEIMLRDALPRCLWGRDVWEDPPTTWEDPEIYQIWTVNQANQNDWLKETQKRCPIKAIQTSMRVRLSHSVSPWVCLCVQPHVLYIFPLSKYSTCFVTFPLCEILFCKAEGPGVLSLTTGLVAGIRCFHLCDPAQSLSVNQAPLQAISSWGHLSQYEGERVSEFLHKP